MGDLLEEDEDYKEYIVSVIEKRLNRKIASTRLVYRYDTLNKTNFHKYIDNQEQLVIIIKLLNGFMLAAWTEGSFTPKMSSKKDGLIFSLTNRKVFDLMVPNTRAISYDDFYLIFGNSEVRIKHQDNKVFSNFAVGNAYYNNHGCKV